MEAPQIQTHDTRAGTRTLAAFRPIAVPGVVTVDRWHRHEVVALGDGRRRAAFQRNSSDARVVPSGGNPVDEPSGDTDAKRTLVLDRENDRLGKSLRRRRRRGTARAAR